MQCPVSGKKPVQENSKRDDSYGNLLYDYLGRFLPMAEIRSIIEIGGGYGYLMRDFLSNNPSLKVTMLDISPFLSKKQRKLFSYLQGMEGACAVAPF